MKIFLSTVSFNTGEFVVKLEEYKQQTPPVFDVPETGTSLTKILVVFGNRNFFQGSYLVPIQIF